MLSGFQRTKEKKFLVTIDEFVVSGFKKNFSQFPVVENEYAALLNETNGSAAFTLLHRALCTNYGHK